MLVMKKDISTMSDSEFRLWLLKMPQEKQKTINAYRKEDDRKRSVCGYMIAVKALSQFLNKNPGDITIAYDENGKPITDGASLSIAHAGSFAVCAVSDCPVGIDAEVMRKMSLRAALRVCTKKELMYIFGDDFNGTIPENADDETKLRFLEIWTKKEAYGKMLGTGIIYDMKNTDVMNIKTWRDGVLIISATQKEN